MTAACTSHVNLSQHSPLPCHPAHPPAPHSLPAGTPALTTSCPCSPPAGPGQRAAPQPAVHLIHPQLRLPLPAALHLLCQDVCAQQWPFHDAAVHVYSARRHRGSHPVPVPDGVQALHPEARLWAVDQAGAAPEAHCQRACQLHPGGHPLRLVLCVPLSCTSLMLSVCCRWVYRTAAALPLPPTAAVRLGSVLSVIMWMQLRSLAAAVLSASGLVLQCYCSIGPDKVPS